MHRLIRRIELFIIFSSWAVAITLIIVGNQPNEYSLLFLLPLVFAIVTYAFFLFAKDDIAKNIGIIVVFGQLYVRNVITPLIMCMGDYRTNYSIESLQFIPNAIFLMIFEVVCCFIVSLVATKKKSLSIRRLHNNNSGKLFGIVLWLSLMFCATLWIVFPEIQNLFQSVMKMSTTQVKDNAYTIAEHAQVGTANRTFSTLFTVVFSSFRVIFPSYLIVRIYNEQKGTRGLITSLIVVGTQFFFIPTVVADALIPAILQLILIMDLYKEFKRKLIVISIIVTAGFTLFVFSIYIKNAFKWYGYRNIWQFLSDWFVSYFTGVNNVASAYLLSPENKGEVVLGTLVAAIPFRATLMPSTINMDSIVSIFTALPGCSSQIISTIGLGRYFFTDIFAPAFSVLFTYQAKKYGVKYAKAQNDWKKMAYLYMAVESAFAVGIYNLPITLDHWIQVGIPLLLVSFFAGSDMHPNMEQHQYE